MDKELTILQAEVLYLETEACSQALKRAKVVLAPPPADLAERLAEEEAELHRAEAEARPASSTVAAEDKGKGKEKEKGAPVPAAPTEAAPPPQTPTEGPAPPKPASTIEELQRLLPMSILKGMGLGIATKQPWLVMNGASYAWNHYRHVTEAERYTGLLNLLRIVMDRMMQATAEEEKLGGPGEVRLGSC